jgi:hypothetical protein
MKAFVKEAEKEIPIAYECDVAVAGGGTSGVAAAVCAARMGLSVVMIERTSQPGGILTGVIKSFEDFSNKGGFVKEFVEYMTENGLFEHPFFNPFYVTPYFDRLIEEAGVRHIYLASVCDPIVEDGKVNGLFIESKSGRTAVIAKIVIDATGDGDAAAKAGAGFMMGRDSDGLWQAFSASSMLSNYKGPPLNGSDLEKIIEKCNKVSGRNYKLPFAKSSIRTLPKTEGTVWHSIPHVTEKSPLNSEELSDAVVELRKQAWELFCHLKKYSPEFKDAEFGPFSPLPGVRESRRIICDFNIPDEAAEGAEYEDGLFYASWPMSLHKCSSSDKDIELKPVKPFHVPYRSLLPVNIENMLVCGRCIGAGHEILATCRIAANCMASGEAAAIAAKMSLEKGLNLREIEINELRNEMKQRGYKN